MKLLAKLAAVLIVVTLLPLVAIFFFIGLHQQTPSRRL